MGRIFPAAGSGGGRCCLCRRWPSKGGGFRSVGRAPRRPAAAVTPQEKGPLRQLCAPQRGARWRSWCRLYLIHCRGAAALRRHRGTAAQRSVAGQKTGRIPGGQRMITVHMDEVGFEVKTISSGGFRYHFYRCWIVVASNAPVYTRCRLLGPTAPSPQCTGVAPPDAQAAGGVCWPVHTGQGKSLRRSRTGGRTMTAGHIPPACWW